MIMKAMLNKRINIDRVAKGYIQKFLSRTFPKRKLEFVSSEFLQKVEKI